MKKRHREALASLGITAEAYDIHPGDDDGKNQHYISGIELQRGGLVLAVIEQDYVHDARKYHIRPTRSCNGAPVGRALATCRTQREAIAQVITASS